MANGHKPTEGKHTKEKDIYLVQVMQEEVNICARICNRLIEKTATFEIVFHFPNIASYAYYYTLSSIGTSMCLNEQTHTHAHTHTYKHILSMVSEVRGQWR